MPLFIELVLHTVGVATTKDDPTSHTASNPPPPNFLLMLQMFEIIWPQIATVATCYLLQRIIGHQICYVRALVVPPLSAYSHLFHLSLWPILEGPPSETW
mmetsp:Transcript_152609/g.266468  ORF Transcript_152609/g.266468 Transcript_152609/m.266468 type:complete len:100 (-) Transcript_152609:86-385(-)